MKPCACPISLLVALLISPALCQPVQWPVSQGGNGHYYEVVSVAAGIGWPAANQAALNAGGYLASITSSAENNFVFGLLSGSQYWSGTFGPWIGGFQPPGSPEPAGGWVWTSGETFSFTSWHPQEPSNSQWQGNYEDYIHYYFNAALWNDFPPQGPTPGYVAEYPSMPEFQQNSPHSGFTINSVLGNSSSPAIVGMLANATGSLNVSSSTSGLPWELGYGLTPLVPASTGALTTAGGQVLNLDLTDPTFGVLWNYFNSPGFVSATIPFSVPNPAAVSVQMLVVAPTLIDGVALSQPTRLIVQ